MANTAITNLIETAKMKIIANNKQSATAKGVLAQASGEVADVTAYVFIDELAQDFFGTVIYINDEKFNETEAAEFFSC